MRWKVWPARSEEGAKNDEDTDKSGTCDVMLDKLMRAYVLYPGRVFCSCACFMLLLAIIAVASGAMAFSDAEGVWSVMDSEATHQFVMYDQATKLRDKLDQDNLDQVDLFSKSMPGLSQFTINYKSVDGGNIFRPEQLSDMCRFERTIFKSKLFKEYCSRSGGNCMATTPVKVFYNVANLSGHDWSCEALDEGVVATKRQEMMNSLQTLGGNSPYAMYMDKQALGAGNSQLSRTIIPLGYPSAKAKVKYSKERESGVSKTEAEEKAVDEQREELQPLVDDVEEALFKLPKTEMAYSLAVSAYQVDDDRFAELEHVKVRFMPPWKSDFDMIQGDFMFAFLSIVFVFLYMSFHLKSFFMAAAGMFQIVCSLPVASIFYRGLFQIRYFHFLHLLTVFLVLGIGADDIFVLTDTWKISAKLVKPKGNCSSGEDGTGEAATVEDTTDEADAYTPAQLQERMSITYRRTASAIFNTSFTTACAFLSCSISRSMPMRTNGWFAALAVVFNFVFTCSLTPATIMIHHRWFKGKCCGCCPISKTGWLQWLCGSGGAGAEGLLKRFYVPAMRWKPAAMRGVAPIPLVLVVILTAVAIQGVHFTSKLTPPTEEEMWFPSNHMHTYYFTYVRDSYFGVDADSQALMTLFWGVKDLDKSEYDTYDPWKNPGEPVFDGGFDLGKPEVQQAILDTCAALRSLPCDLDGCRAAASYGKTFVLGIDHSVACFLEDFKTWKGGTLPQGPEFFAELQRFRREHAPSPEQRGGSGANWEEQIGFVGGTLKYVSVKFRSSMPNGEPMGTGKDVQDKLAEWTKERRRASPAGTSGPYYESSSFVWFDSSVELMNGLFSGCAIAGPIAFLVLIYATLNLVVSLYAVACVASIVLCVLGFCKSAMDYDLGIGESIAGVIVIGLAVDYAVHLAHMYVEAEKYEQETRDARATFAITNMGVTVFAGAITTAGAGLIMFLCFSTFFHKMAVLMSITIFYSFLFSLGLFVPLLYLVGPEGSCGDLKVCYHWLRSRAAGGRCRAAGTK